jgi:hypothetical protein
MPVYLHLFHGRKSPDEQLDDWGEDGPVLGPLKYVHTTYARDLKVETAEDEPSGRRCWLARCFRPSPTNSAACSSTNGSQDGAPRWHK